MRKNHTINLSYVGGKTKIIVERDKLVFVPITPQWLNNIETDELLIICKKININPDRHSGKNTHKKLRDLIMKKQK